MTNNKVSTADTVVAGSILISLTLLLTDYSSLAPLVLLAGIMYYLMLYGPPGF
jgi:MFS superfamily sulfate permease-like transporter